MAAFTWENFDKKLMKKVIYSPDTPENVRPIHGWDGVKVTACGKNLAPPLSNTDFWSIK